SLSWLLAVFFLLALFSARRSDGHLVVRAPGDVLLRVITGVARLQPVFEGRARQESDRFVLRVLETGEIDRRLVIKDMRVAAVGEANLLVRAIRPRLAWLGVQLHAQRQFLDADIVTPHALHRPRP